MGDRTCAVDGCDRVTKARGMCASHYSRWSRHGDPLAGGPARLPGDALERFTARCPAGAPDECWEWTGARTRSGYGSLRAGGVVVYAHRMAYEFAFGPIPAGMHVMHRCDNPPCCNPAHLTLGTAAENMADKAAKGRQTSHKATVTHCPAGHEYDAANTYVCTRRQRHCRACSRERARRRRDGA